MKNNTKNTAQIGMDFAALLGTKHNLLLCYMNTDNTHLNIAVKTAKELGKIRIDLARAGMVLEGTYTAPDIYANHWSASFRRK